MRTALCILLPTLLSQMLSQLDVADGQQSIQRVNFPNLVAARPGWKSECPFFNKVRARSLIETYLANKDTQCTRLGLCPKVPRWLKPRDIDWYERIDTDNENLSLLPSFRDGKPLHLFYKFFVENLSSMNLQHMVSFVNLLSIRQCRTDRTDSNLKTKIHQNRTPPI